MIRSLNQIAEQSQRTTRTVKRDNEEASLSFRRVGESAERTRHVIGGLAGIIGLGGLGIGLKDVIKAGTAWQAQQAQLQTALRNTGHFSTDTKNKLMDAAEALSTHGGFGASETLQGMTQFARLGLNVRQTVDRVTLATNIARSSGRDFTQVLRALMMAEQGRTTGLARLGVAIPKVTTAEMSLKNAALGHKDALLQLEAAGVKLTAMDKARLALHNQITPAMEAQAKAADQQASIANVFTLLQQRYGGSTAAFSNTTAGHISNLRNTIDITNKEMSQRLLPTVTALATAGANVLLFLLHNKALLIGLGVAIGTVTAILTAHALAMEVLKAKTIVLNGIQSLFGRRSEEAAARVGGMAATVADKTSPALAGLAVSARRAAEALDLIHGGGGGFGGGGGLSAEERAAADAGKGGGFLSKLGGGAVGRFAEKFGLKTIGKFATKLSPWGLGAGILATIANHTGIPLPGPLKTISNIIGFADGGVTPYSGTFMVGERGPELVSLPGGSTVHPNAGGPIVINLTSVLRMPNGRELTRVVTQTVLDKAARGTLGGAVGGSLVTGGYGLPA